MKSLLGYKIVDLSVCLDEGRPLTWPGLPQFQKRVLNWYEPIFGPHQQPLTASIGPFYAQRLSIDEHTGTHVDYPPHNIPPSSSRLENAGMAGDAPGESYPIQNLWGPAAVLDLRWILDQAPPLLSPSVTPDMIESWEKKHGRIEPGDIVVLNSGYTDKYFRPFPEGRRLYAPVSGENVPGWPAPSAAAVEMLHARGVRHLGTSAPSIGAVEDLAAAHLAGLSRGMSFSEMLVNLTDVPPRGAYFFALPLKIAAQSGGPARAFALVPK